MAIAEQLPPNGYTPPLTPTELEACRPTPTDDVADQVSVSARDLLRAFWGTV
ncbi:hypothetical protein ACWENQ_27065 [Nonomuraea sp. NPDC004354]